MYRHYSEPCSWEPGAESRLPKEHVHAMSDEPEVGAVDALQGQLAEARATQLNYEAALIRKSEECHDLLHQLETMTVNYETLLLVNSGSSNSGGDSNGSEGGESRKRFSISRFLSSSKQKEPLSSARDIAESIGTNSTEEAANVVDLESQLRDAERKIGSLTATIMAEAQAAAVVKADMDALIQSREDSLTKLQGDYNDAHTRLGAALSERDVLRSSGESCDRNLAEATKRLAEKSSLLERLQIQAEENSGLIATLRGECDATKALVASLTAAEARAIAASEESVQEMYETRDKWLALTSEADADKAELERLRIVSKDREETINRLDDSVREQAATINSLSDECATREAALSQSIVELSQKERIVAELQAKHDAQMQELVASTALADAATQRAAKAESIVREASQLQEQSERYSSEVNRLKKVVDSQASELKKLVKETAAKSQQYEQALLRKSEECHTLLEEVEALHRELNSIDASQESDGQVANSNKVAKKRFSLSRLLARDGSKLRDGSDAVARDNVK